MSRGRKIAGALGNAGANVAIVWWFQSVIGGLVGLVGVVLWSAIAVYEVRRDLTA